MRIYVESVVDVTKEAAHLTRCLGELTVMYVLEKADLIGDPFDNKLARMMDMEDK